MLSAGFRLFVRLSVRLSRSCIYIQTAEDIVKLLSRPGSPIILVFLTPSGDTHTQFPEKHQDKRRFQLKIANFSHPVYFAPPGSADGGSPWNWVSTHGVYKTRAMGLPVRARSLTIFSHANTIHQRDRRTPDDSKVRAYAQRRVAR